MIRMFKYLMYVLEKEEKNLWKILSVFSLISPVMDIFGFSVIVFIINTVTREKQASVELILFTFFMSVISILKGFFELYRCKIYNRFLYEGSQKLSMKIYEVLIKEDLIFHNQKNMMQALSMIRSDTESCIGIVITCIETGANVLTMSGYFILTIFAGKWIGIVSCILILLLMIGMFIRYRVRMNDYGEKSRIYSIKSNAQISIAFGTFKEIKLINNSDAMLRKYKEVSQKYAHIQGEYKFHSSVISMLMQNSVMAIIFIMLGFFLWNPEENLIYILSTTIYIAVLTKMIPLAYSIVSGLNGIEFARKPYEVIKECLGRYEEIKEKERITKSARHKKIILQKGIYVRNLSFCYNDRIQIFIKASMDIPVGHSVAVIGVSGVGKTTFLDLVIGLLKPQEGSIFYDDYDIIAQTDSQGKCEANIGEIVSYIPQVVYLNGETIRRNIAFFENEEKIDDNKVIECLKCAQIWDDVARMPEGIDTLIDENATIVSGGQRQRLGLARALYRDFELLVMDEATAALDMETEKAVIDSIRQVKKNKTILMVTHHMSLANECDIIYKIENQGFVRIK